MLDNEIIKNNSNFIFISTLKKIIEIKKKKNLSLSSLIEINEQKYSLINNTKNFLDNKPFNNALLWGAKGMGKSSLIFSMTNHFNKVKKKLKLLEVFSSDMKFLPEIVYNLNKSDFKFIIFIDDIVLDINKNDFKIFKVLLEGSLLSKSENLVFYITSNSRHIVKPEINKDLNDIQYQDQLSNTISLSDRFGLSLGFHKCSKQQYLKIVKMYLKNLKINLPYKDVEKKAMEWSIQKGDFSGRIALQFVINLSSKIL